MRQVAALLLVSATVFAAGGDDRLATPPPDPPRSALAPPTVALAHEGLPEVVPWRAGPWEPAGDVKEAATRLVESAGSWTAPGGGRPAAMATRLEGAGYSGSLATQLVPLRAAAPAATTRVVNPQYGGLGPTDASVIVRGVQTLAGTSEPMSRELVLDLRMGRSGDGRWTVTAVGAPRRLGAPVPVGHLARSVLSNPRVIIPAPGRADIATGLVSDRILSILDELSRRYRIEVQVITTGHHGLVWGTPRASNHAVGRAVDVWRVDGRPVALADPAVVRAFMVDAARAGATEVGGPVPVDGQGFFTDAVHSDHVHIGVNPVRPPAELRLPA